MSACLVSHVMVLCVMPCITLQHCLLVLTGERALHSPELGPAHQIITTARHGAQPATATQQLLSGNMLIRLDV